MCDAPSCPIPYGLCHCGCGQKTRISPETSRYHGFVKGEPRRFVKGHNDSRHEKAVQGMVSQNISGFCLCGCGQRAPVAKVTCRKYGWIRGESMKYIRGHCGRVQEGEIPPPNPEGLCACGCGQPAPIAPESLRGKGWVKGQPLRYLPHHHKGSALPLLEQFLRRVRTLDGPGACWEWRGYIHPSGYGRTSVGGKIRSAHRLAWFLASGEEAPKGATILHTCDNPLCVRNDEAGVYVVGEQVLPRYGHLVCGTMQQNTADKVAKGRQHTGRLSRPANFTDEEVHDSRTAYRNRDMTGVTISSRAEQYGRSFVTIIRLLHRRSYAYLP